MAAGQYRRPRGTPVVALNLFVSPEVKERIDLYSARSNMPIWAIVEAAVLAGEPDATTGVPAGWGLPDDGTSSLPGINGGGDAVRSDP